MPSPHSTTSPSDSLPFRVADARKRGYFTVDNIVLDEYGALLKPCGIAVYACLCRFANQDQECWPSHATVAKRCGMSKTQVKREIAKLAELELVLITPQYNPDTKQHSSNVYTLLDVQGGSPQAPGGESPQAPVRARQGYRTIPKKKDPGPKDQQEDDAARRRSYIPDEYRNIILG